MSWQLERVLKCNFMSWLPNVCGVILFLKMMLIALILKCSTIAISQESTEDQHVNDAITNSGKIGRSSLSPFIISEATIHTASVYKVSHANQTGCFALSLRIQKNISP